MIPVAGLGGSVGCAVRLKTRRSRVQPRRGRQHSFVEIDHEIFSTVILSLPLGWSGGVKVSCILCHWGVQLILAYNWARPAILVAGKGREVMFLFLLFLHFHSCYSFFPVPLFHLLCYLFCCFFSGRRHKMTHKGWRVVKPQHNQSFSPFRWFKKGSCQFLAKECAQYWWTA